MGSLDDRYYYRSIAGFDREGRSLRSFLMESPTDAAESVAAGAPLTSISVKHTHTEIGVRAWAEQHETIASDTTMPIAHLTCDGRGILEVGDSDIDVDIVVAEAMHFRKRDHY